MNGIYNQIYCNSAEDLSMIPHGAISLTITSPPYFNAIDYDRHTDNPDQDYRTRQYGEGFSNYDEYLLWLTAIFTDLLNKTKDGGFLSIVIGTVLYEGGHFPVPFHLTSLLINKGWEFWQDIIWNKVTGGVKRAGLFIQYPYPGYYRPNIMTEYILIFKKPGPLIYRDRLKEEKEGNRFPINKIYTKDIANNIWHIAPVPPKILKHPCPFPEEIPFRLISLYSYVGDVIFDPFNGSGQTTKVAHHLRRRYIGFDTKDTYVEYAKERLKESLSIRSQQLISEIAKINLNAPCDLKKKEKTRHGAGKRSARNQ